MPTPPIPTPQAGLRALKALRTESILSALQSFHADCGDIFQVNLPGFRPVFMAGANACQFVLTTAHDDLLWRQEQDPVVRLLGHGLLVTDGAEHDQLRKLAEPALHRNLMQGFLTSFQLRTRQALSTWQTGNHYEMLAEMRKIALLILVDCLFGADFTPYLQSLWHSILRTLAYISPGLWLIFPDLPRFGYQAAIAKVDGYLFSLIQHRRTHPIAGDDLLSLLIAAGLDDRLIRDQLLTMLIAGHDTSTALLAWALYCLGKSPDHLEKVAAEVRAVPLENPFSLDDLKSFTTLEWVLQETLRLYPPIHAGNRLTNRAISFNGFTIPAHQRVIYSIYLTQRHPDFWQSPNQFMPERFLQRPAAWTYLPFGGGERICIGYLFAQIEAKAVLATLLREWQVQLLPQRVSLHMGATLEPRPGVRMKVTQIAR